jgi:hypothetical protein
MIRAIAKILMEYYHDSRPSTALDANNLTHLPKWLRARIDADSELQKVEQELLGLERSLVSQARDHLAKGHPIASPEVAPEIDFVYPASKPLHVAWTSPMALTALAAGLCCMLLASRWLLTRSTTDPTEATVDIAVVPSQSSHGSKPRVGEEWMRSASAATKRIVSDFKVSQDITANRFAVVNRTMLEESEQLKVLGREGLRFVAQKLPAASVRFVGMSSNDRRAL